MPVVTRHFSSLRQGLASNLQRLQSTDWEGNAKLAAVDAVQGFTNSAQQKCDSAEQTLTKYITDQVNSVDDGRPLSGRRATRIDGSPSRWDGHAAADVRFDFDGSLALARRLWRFADELDGSRHRPAQPGRAGADDVHRGLRHASSRSASPTRFRTSASPPASCAPPPAPGRRPGRARSTSRTGDCSPASATGSRATAACSTTSRGSSAGTTTCPRSRASSACPSRPHFAATGSFVRY